jgi:excisionase family DNA binding protein
MSVAESSLARYQRPENSHTGRTELKGAGQTVYDLARTGRLPHLRIGRALRFSRQDLEAHLAEQCRIQTRLRA